MGIFFAGIGVNFLYFFQRDDLSLLICIRIHFLNARITIARDYFKNQNAKIAEIWE